MTFTATEFAPDFAETGVRVTNYFDAGPGLVRIVIGLKTNFALFELTGGFEVVSPAEFSQNPERDAFRESIALNDTAFLGEPTDVIIATDTTEFLYAQEAKYVGDWPGSGTGEFFNFAQLVLPTAGAGDTIANGKLSGPIAFTDDSGEIVAELYGTVSAVPEPASLLLMGMGLFGLGLIVHRRRGNKS